MSDVEIVDLGLVFNGSSTSIRPEGLTLHYGGPSPWSGSVDRSSPEAFMSTANHNRCPTIARAWHAYHLSKGWFGLAYNDVVCPHGVIYKGRGPGYRSGANGSNEGNFVSPAICYIGGDGDPFTEPAKAAYKACEARYGVPLIWPHQHWTSTSCPGNPILAWVKSGFAVSSKPIPTVRKKAKMFCIVRLNDGRLVRFSNYLGAIVHAWQPAPNSGPWSAWAGLNNGQSPGAFDSVDAAVNADGRIELIAWHSAYNVPFTCWQVKAAGAWGPWARL